MTNLLTAEEVAAMLGMSTDWIYAETRSGRIPHVKLGRYRRYRAETIEQWIADLERETMPATTKAPPRPRQRPGGMAQEE